MRLSRKLYLYSFNRAVDELSANRQVSKNGHVGSAEIGAKMPTEVNSLCPNPLLLIASHSPHALLKTGLRLCHPEKSRDSNALHCRVVRSLQSSLSRKNREIRACFAHFAGNRGRNSLQSGLRGGGSVIRTRITVLNSATPDVCLTCRQCST